MAIFCLANKSLLTISYVLTKGDCLIQEGGHRTIPCLVGVASLIIMRLVIFTLFSNLTLTHMKPSWQRKPLNDTVKFLGLSLRPFFGSAFTSNAFQEHISRFNQVVRFAGVGGHGNNGVAERSIRTIMSISRAMLLHSAIHWPAVADVSLWPMAVSYAVFIWNHVPNLESGPKTRWPQHRFQN